MSKNIYGHDAEIFSIDLDRRSSACRLGLFHEGKKFSLELFEIVALRIEDFGLQNVVSRILCATKRDFSEADLSHWMQWATSLSDAPSWLNSEKNQEWINAIRKSEMELIVLEPSVGAQIVAICGRIVHDFP